MFRKEGQGPHHNQHPPTKLECSPKWIGMLPLCLISTGMHYRRNIIKDQNRKEGWKKSTSLLFYDTSRRNRSPIRRHLIHMWVTKQPPPKKKKTWSVIQQIVIEDDFWVMMLKPTMILHNTLKMSLIDLVWHYKSGIFTTNCHK